MTRAAGGKLRRFQSAEIESDRVVILPADHPAVVEGRTLYPSRVKREHESQRYLVSGRNNAKIGAFVTKGDWAKMPIFTLTLEERATCPRSCAQWLSCYGSGMQFANRWDHTDPDFLPALKAEIITTARAHPNGLVVRLHVLGDFYSVPYLQMWADMLDAFPNLHIYGYTARHEDDSDEESRRIATGIRWLTEQAWDQFAIRFSNRPERQGTIVITDHADAGDAIICPASLTKTETCGTCGLCWAPAARDKTIAFPLHGRKGRGAATYTGNRHTIIGDRMADELAHRRATMGIDLRISRRI